MINSRVKMLITILVGVLLITSCRQQALPELQSATSAPTSQPNVTSVPTSQPIVTSTMGQVSTTPAGRPFTLPSGRLLLAANAKSGGLNQYNWLQLPDMTITPHSYLTGDYPARDQDVTISPDLTHLAFAHEVFTQSGDNLYAGDSVSVLLADPDGNQATQVGQPFSADYISQTLNCGDGISWAANSQVFAFARSLDWNSSEKGHHLYVYDLLSGQFKTLAIQAYQTSSFSLSPDGTQIAFTSFGERLGLSLINVDGSSQQLIVEGFVKSNLVWHPDGKQIFFIMDKPELGIYTVDISTGVTKLITATSEKANCLGLSPDFRLLAYDDGGIWVINSDGGEPLQLTHAGNKTLVWSPDSQYIAYISAFDPKVYVMDTVGRGKVSVYPEDKMDLLQLIGWLP
jgi:WD40 repeat protein